MLLLCSSFVDIYASVNDVQVKGLLALAASAIQEATVHGEQISVLCVAARSSVLCGVSAADSVLRRKDEAA